MQSLHNLHPVFVQDDPLTQTLDKLFSVDLRDTVTEVPVNIPQGVKDICSELEKEEGIDSVVLGRQAEDRRVVSQVKPDVLCCTKCTAVMNHLQ